MNYYSGARRLYLIQKKEERKHLLYFILAVVFWASILVGIFFSLPA